MTDDFPRRFRALREGMRPVRSRRATSELMGLPPDAVGKYERGDARPGFDALRLIADFYGVSTDYLLGRTDRRC